MLLQMIQSIHIWSRLGKVPGPAPDKSRHFIVGILKKKTDRLLFSIAWMQMYFALSQLYQPGGPDIELFESDETDVRLAHGYIFPQPRLDSPGVRVLIRSPPKTA